MDLLAHLEAFVAIAERRSFTHAAEDLGLPQPLLSRRIRHLEDDVGGELFDRSRRRIAVTELGRTLLPDARDLVHRARRFREVAETAGRTALRVVGVPPGCAPAALARVIRAGTERGTPVSVHEAPAQDRAAGLAAGEVDLALVGVPAVTAALVVPLGLAAAGPLPGVRAGRPAHLDVLRPRRTAPAVASSPAAATSAALPAPSPVPVSAAPPALLLLPEDDHRGYVDRLRRAMARAGLADRRLRVASSPAAAAAEVLAGAAVLLCDGAFARDHDLTWTPLADAALHRGYELAAATGRSGRRAGSDADWLLPLLRTAVGARRPDRPAVRPADARARLAARA